MTCGKRAFLAAVCLMFFASFWMLRGVPVQAEDSTSASEERIVYSFTDGSGSYLVQKGERWYLRDANGKALTGIQYLAIKKNDVLMRGYYMFNSNGKLIRKRAVYYLKTTVNGVKFKGYYYTSSNGRFPTNASGLTKISSQTCNSKTFDGYYYVQEYGKLNTSGAQVRLLSNKKVGGVTFNGYYYFNSTGELNTARKFHKVSQTVGSVTFNGKYYFMGTNGVLLRQAGWITYNGNQYYIDSNGKMLTDCWQDGYYLLSNGKIAKSQQVADGSYVDSDGRKCEAEEMVLSGLKKTISSMVSSYGGTWSVYVKNLETGDVLSVNDCTMYPASTIKVFVMASVYNEIANGRMSETSTITSLLTSMITVSSNESYNELVRRQSSSGSSFLNGAAVVNSYLKANGYTSTAVHHTLHPSSSSSTSDGSKNVSSAKDCGKLLEAIYNGTCVSKTYSQKMLNLLLAQERRYKIPAGVPSGIKVANKTGETSTTQHDIAIVFGEKTDYVICVFSSGVSEYTAIRGIKSISSTVYEYLN